MRTLHYSTVIDEPAKRVWDVMLGAGTSKEGTARHYGVLGANFIAFKD